jgi:hypothetical protein
MQTSQDVFQHANHAYRSAEDSDEELEADDEKQEIVWFDRRSFTPIPPPLHTVELLPYGFSGDRLWRARGWSTED